MIAAGIAAILGLLIQSPQAAAPNDSVALRFDWPVGLTAVVETERTKTAVIDGKTRQTMGGMRYRMRVQAHPEGRLISYSGFEPIGKSLSALEAQGVEEFMTSLMPRLIVSPEGEFIRVADLTEIRAAISEFLADVKAKTPGAQVPAGAQAILDGLTSEQVLSQLASAEWQTAVGAFVGFTGRLGAPEDVDSEEPSPVMPDLLVPMRTTFGALKRVACEAGRPPDSCVVMQVRSVVAPGGMEKLSRRMLDGVKDLNGLKYERFDVTNEVLSILDPSTLRPYRIVHTKRVEFTMSMPGQGTASGSQTDERIIRIAYGR